MARSPLIIDTPIGKLYAIDLGGGACMLMIEQDGSAQTFPIDAAEAKRLGQYLRPIGRPGSSQVLTEEVLQEAADLYISDEAGASGSRMKWCAEQLGITVGQMNSRISRAKQLGIMTAKFNPGNGERIQ